VSCSGSLASAAAARRCWLAAWRSACNASKRPFTRSAALASPLPSVFLPSAALIDSARLRTRASRRFEAGLSPVAHVASQSTSGTWLHARECVAVWPRKSAHAAAGGLVGPPTAAVQPLNACAFPLLVVAATRPRFACSSLAPALVRVVLRLSALCVPQQQVCCVSVLSHMRLLTPPFSLRQVWALRFLHLSQRRKDPTAAPVSACLRL